MIQQIKKLHEGKKVMPHYLVSELLGTWFFSILAELTRNLQKFSSWGRPMPWRYSSNHCFGTSDDIWINKKSKIHYIWALNNQKIINKLIINKLNRLFLCTVWQTARSSVLKGAFCRAIMMYLLSSWSRARLWSWWLDIMPCHNTMLLKS